MGDSSGIYTPNDCDAPVVEQPHALLFGSIPAGDGMWRTLADIITCASLRNGALVVFSAECSGRIGIFCNRFITGAIIDSTKERGLPACKRLLKAGNGMFCFRPCLDDELSELNQLISLDIDEALKIRLADLRSGPAVEATAQTTNATSTTADEQSAPAPESTDVGQTADAESSDPDGAEPEQQVATTHGTETMLSGDLDLYMQVLKEEDARINACLESTQATAVDGSADLQKSARTRDEMQLLADLIRREKQRLAGQALSCDDRLPQAEDVAARGVPTSSGSDWVGEPSLSVNTSWRGQREIANGCEDLISQRTKAINARDFVSRTSTRLRSIRMPWWRKTKYRIGIFVICLVVLSVGTFLHLYNLALQSCLNEGKDSLKAENFPGAIACFTKAIEKFPQNAEAYYYRAIAYIETDQRELALNDLEQAVEMGFDQAKVAAADASITIRAGDWDRTLDFCQQAIDAGGGSAEIYRLRAICHTHLLDYSAAIKDLSDALDRCQNDPPLSAQLRADRGYAEIHEGRMHDGITDFAYALKIAPNKETYMRRGDAFRTIRQYDAAIGDYSRVLKLDPLNDRAYVARGISEVALHRDAPALEDFTAALQAKNDSVEALIQRGSLHLAHGSYRLAVNDLEDAYNLNPAIREINEKLAAAYSHLHRQLPKKLSSTLGAQAASLKLPSSPSELVGIGYKYYVKGELTEATTCFTQAVRLAPANADARRYLAYALTASGSTDEGDQQFALLARWRRLNTDDALVYARNLQATGQVGRALEALETALRDNPSSIDLRAQLARCYYLLGQTAKARDICSESMKLAKTDSQREKLRDALPQSTGDTTGGIHDASSQ